jgi:hypothetical protein
MDTLTLPKPWVYKKKWLVWPKVVLDFIDVVGCNDTIDGICTTGKSVEECLDTCVRGCGAGYHVQFQNGKSICVPILTNIHPHLNPAYRLRKQSIYPNLDHVVVSTFINTEIFPFPPNYGNAIFYRDILSISPLDDTSVTVGTLDSTDGIYIGKKHDDNIQLVLAEKIVEKFAYYVPVQYGDNVVLIIPGTSMIATVDMDSQDLSWKASYTNTGLPNATFTILPTESHKIGDVVAYGDPIIFGYQGEGLFLVKDPVYNSLKILYENLSNITSNPNAIFTCTSKMIGWYCQNGMCKSVPIKNIVKNGTSGTYNGSIVDRNNACWGICKKDTLFGLKSTMYTTPWILIVGITVAVIASLFAVKLYQNRRKLRFI